MSYRELERPIRGIIPPLVTPLVGPDRLDEAGLERLIEYMLAGGVHGLFALGSCGEGPSISHRVRRQLIDRTCAIVDGRVPVLVGITDPCRAESLHLARHAADAGADAVVLSAPYYYPITQDELVGYVKQLAAESPLPVTLYNMPSLTRTSFELESVQQLVDEPAIVGMKDSSGDLEYFRDLLTIGRQRDDWSLLVGQEHLLLQVLELGADGGVCGGANVWPQAFVQLYEATLATTETAIAEQGDVLPHLVDQVDRLAQIYRVAGETITAPSVIKGLKGALAAMGIAAAEVAPPLEPLSAAEQAHVATILQELGFQLGLQPQRT
ncbi:MAG: dihydrodipicolinate synthase family protein [Pirellulales bacterium]